MLCLQLPPCPSVSHAGFLAPFLVSVVMDGGHLLSAQFMFNNLLHFCAGFVLNFECKTSEVFYGLLVSFFLFPKDVDLEYIMVPITEQLLEGTEHVSLPSESRQWWLLMLWGSLTCYSTEVCG